MKKLFMLIPAVLMLSVSAVYADGINIFINGNRLESDVQPFIENDRTLVPMRAIFESLGASVVWDGETHTVFAIAGDTVVSIQTGEMTAFVNSEPKTLDTAAKIVNDRTFVPLRFVSESLGCKVDWDGSSQTVTISK